MLAENFVLGLLQASITGAGLILAVYALITPLSRRIFSHRAEEIYSELERLKARIQETNATASDGEFHTIFTMLQNISGKQTFPVYLSWGSGLTFFFFFLSTFLSLAWFAEEFRSDVEVWLSLVFFFSTISFLVVGLVSIKEITFTMSREFKELKEEVQRARAKQAFIAKLPEKSKD